LRRLRLRPMSPDEFGPWRSFAIDEYAAETERNLLISTEAAREKAEGDFLVSLPDGLNTPEHWLNVVEDSQSGERMGILWHGPGFRRDPGTAFLFNIWLEEDARGQGLGKELMLMLEDEVRSIGKSRIELNVFGDNQRARNLYESLGYKEMSRLLFKDLQP
jgi:ribosomal protein S18 acetylase RimI-like enzyme